MPEITPAVVAKIARLANLKISEEELASFSGQLEKILEYIHKLNQVDTHGVAQTAHALPLQNIWRADEMKPGLDRSEALAAAPDVYADGFRVPRIIE